MGRTGQESSSSTLTPARAGLQANLPGNAEVSVYRHHGLEARATKYSQPEALPGNIGTPVQADGETRPMDYGRNTRMFLLTVSACLMGVICFAPLTDHKAAAAPPAQNPASPEIVFNRDIRPILSNTCFTCHGPDNNKRQAKLRLDRPDNILGPLPKHSDRHAFVPGKPDQSEVYRRIASTDPAEVMPPPTAPLKLSERDREMIRQWIEQGARWQEHWAFVKPERRQPPPVHDAGWCRNDIDRFLLAAMEHQGLHPSPEADKATLMRRVSLALTGIPPTPAEVDAFIADPAPDAYEKIVDRLLASPRYGEQMAITWLDYARYADSHGFQSDPERRMWPWRDWVIRAYNANMPFDQFTIEQLAGDLLPDATLDQKVATGFNRNHRINSEGGAIAEEWRIENVIDRVETTSAVFMGLTMGCARCHEHKYDPITHKEFYQFFAFFNNVPEKGDADSGLLDRGNNAPPVLKIPSPEEQQQVAVLSKQIAGSEAQLKQIEQALPQRQKDWEAAGAKLAELGDLILHLPLNGNLDSIGSTDKPLTGTVEGAPAANWSDGKFGKAIHFAGKDVSINVCPVGQFERTDAFSYGCWVKLRGQGGTLLSRMNGDATHRGFDLLAKDGKFTVHLINEWEKNAISTVTRNPYPKDQWFHVMVTYDGSAKAAGVKILIDGKPQQLQPTQDQLTGTIVAEAPLLIGRRPEGMFLEGDLHDVRIYHRALRNEEVAAIAQRPQIEPVLCLAADKRNPEQNKQLTAYFQLFVPELAEVRGTLDTSRRDLDKLNKRIPDTMVMEEMPQPRKTHLLIRGQYNQPGEQVTAGVPAVLPPLPPGAPANRLGLAKWIVDPANPLTARVQVNRFWEKFFGFGIVKTTENLGTQAEWPANPELLDWLATEFIRLHWDQKAIQKLIVTSAAYRQSSAITPQLLEHDPDNRLAARGPRMRLPAETLRDQALAISGLLVEKLGGPSVKPYQPKNVWEGNRFGNLAVYNQDHGAGLYRRTLYSFWKRTAAPPSQMLFDEPSREFCVVRRSRTNTPLQALTLMNEVTYLEAARVLAEHMMTDGGSTPDQRIAYAFRRVICRPPSAEEARILLAGLLQRQEKYRKDREAAAKLIKAGETTPNTALDVSELAAYTLTASVILNLDETVTNQ